MKADFSKELNVLLTICSNQFSENKSSIAEVDWDELLMLVKYHRVTPQVYKNLSNSSFKVPEHFRKQITSETKRSSVRALSFTAEISSICSGLRKKSISIIPLKGPIAAKQIYGDYTAKSSRDIDFLIHEKNIEEVIVWLESQEYVNNYPFNSLTNKQKKAFLNVNNQLVFFHLKKKIQVEVHWRLFANSHLLPLSFSDILKESFQMTVGKTKVQCFSNEHLLFYLCSHGAKHNWSLLYWLVEIANLIQKEKFNWNNTLKQAIQLGIERPLVQACILIEKLLKVKSPECIKVYYLKDQVIQDLVQSAVREIQDNYQLPPHKKISDYWHKLNYKMKLKKSFRYKLAYWNPISIKDYELLKLPDSLFFVYFWLRPVFWCWRYIFQPIKK